MMKRAMVLLLGYGLLGWGLVGLVLPMLQSGVLVLVAIFALARGQDWARRLLDQAGAASEPLRFIIKGVDQLIDAGERRVGGLWRQRLPPASDAGHQREVPRPANIVR